MEFKCKFCGKEYSLADMHYISYDKFRLCNNCFSVYKEERFKSKAEDNKRIIQEYLKNREKSLLEKDC